MTIAAWLMALIGPLVVRGMIALAFTTVTFAGVTALVASMVAMAVSNWSQMPVTVLQLCTLSGIPEVMGMLFAAQAAKMAMWAATGAKRFVLKT